MSRQKLQLTDDQARILVKLMPAILDRHPAGARDLRAFAYDFIDAVHRATGRTFSPTIYQRWLPTYAPGRMPSTDTLASVKDEFDASSARQPVAGAAPDAGPAENLAAVVSRAVDDAFRRSERHAAGSAADRRAQAQIEQLQAQLTAAEQRTGDARAQAARLAGELQAARAACEQLQAQVDAGKAASGQLAKNLNALANELAEMRKFAMSAVDGVRGETRAWQLRCSGVEAKLHRSKQHLEVFRQLAYRRGAEIPAIVMDEDAG